MRVSVRAFVRVLASRMRASGRGFWFVLPGLVGLVLLGLAFEGMGALNLLEVVEGDS